MLFERYLYQKKLTLIDNLYTQIHYFYNSTREVIIIFKL